MKKLTAIGAGIACLLLVGLLYAGQQGNTNDTQQKGSDSGHQAGSQQAAGNPSQGKPYKVDCKGRKKGNCKVGDETYIGWRTYDGFCLRCHGPGGLGSTIGPSLMKRLDRIDMGRFFYVVANGFKGQVGVMPAWGQNPNVNDKFSNLWAWLNARKDGLVPPGRPDKIAADEEKEFSNWE